MELTVPADVLPAANVQSQIKERLQAHSISRGVDKSDRRITALADEISELRKGDKLSVVYLPGVGTSVAINGRGWPVPGQDFARVVLASWLNPDPAEADMVTLQKCLLGHCPK